MTNPESRTTEHWGRFAYEGLDRTIHEKARLSIVTSLASHPNGLLFNDLKALCRLTDGNLSRHLQLLGDEEIISIEKSFNRNKPQTMCRLTESGHRRFLDYIRFLEGIITDALAVQRPDDLTDREFRERLSPV